MKSIAIAPSSLNSCSSNHEPSVFSDCADTVEGEVESTCSEVARAGVWPAVAGMQEHRSPFVAAAEVLVEQQRRPIHMNRSCAANGDILASDVGSGFASH